MSTKETCVCVLGREGRPFEYESRRGLSGIAEETVNRPLIILAPSFPDDLGPKIAGAAGNPERPPPRTDACARILFGPAVPFDLLDPVGVAARGGGSAARRSGS